MSDPDVPRHCDVVRGRAGELRTVTDLVRRLAGGHGGVLLIEGELGAGKSPLLSRAASDAQAAGVSVAAAAADELGRLDPLGSVLMALGESLAALERVVAGPRRAASPVESLRARLEQRAAVRPLLISLDDLQWADAATLSALRTLPSQLASYPLAWFLARRAPGRDRVVRRLFDLLAAEGATRLALDPLSSDAVAEMITDTLGATPDPGLLELAGGAAGNPLLVAELVGGLLEEDAVVVSHGRASLRSAQVPKRIQEVVRDLIDRLGAQTRHMLDTGAVLGRSFRLEDVAVMLGTSPAALLPGVDEALGVGMLVATQDVLAFRHELVWQAAVQTQALPVRQALHRQAAEILLGQGAAASAAEHLLSCARGSDAEILAGLDRAAAEVLQSWPAVAADLATRALELTPAGDPELMHRRSVAAEALTAAGRLAEAIRLAYSALHMPQPPAASARLRCTLSAALWLSGQDARALLESTRVLAQPRLSPDLRAEAKITLLQGLAGLRDKGRAARLADSVLAAAEPEGSNVVVMALLARAVIAWDSGLLYQALDLSSEAVRMAAVQRADARRCQPQLFLAARLVDLRRFEQARMVLRACADRAVPPGLPGWSATPATLRARMCLAEGRPDDATAEAVADLGMASTLGSDRYGWGASAVLATVALRRGDLAAAAGHMQSPQARRSDFGAAYGDTWDTVVTAQVEEARYGPTVALQELAQVYADLDAHRFLLMCDPACAAWLVRVALGAGDAERAGTAARAADDISQRSGDFAIASASADHACGLAGRDPARLERAVVGHADQWARASAAEDLGALLAVAGSRGEAIARLGQAAEGYEATGAPRDAARARQRLRKLGVRRRHWAVEAKPVCGWSSLTGTELAVSELAAQGLTNQQVADQMFISVHTVAFHLRHVFRKLDISSRVELARLAARRQVPQQPGLARCPAWRLSFIAGSLRRRHQSGCAADLSDRVMCPHRPDRSLVTPGLIFVNGGRHEDRRGDPR
jgi:DNA-binding CsgD family transcriptional regulator